jgi:hypothetical protein
MKKRIYFNFSLIAVSLLLAHQPFALAIDPVSSAIEQNQTTTTSTQKQPIAAELQAQAQQMQSGSQAGNIGQVTAIAKEQAARQTTSGSLGAEGSLAGAMSSSENAGQASKDQSKGSGQNAAMSGVMAVMGAGFAYTAATCAVPGCQPAPAAMAAFSFLQAALGAMQSGNQGDASGANNLAGNDFKTYGGTTSGGTNSGQTSAGGGETNSGGASSGSGSNGGGADYGDNPYASLPAAAREALAKMNALGYKVDLKNKTFTTPDGHSISAKDATSGSAVESQLGLPAGTYAKGMDMMAEIAKKNGITMDGAGVSASGARSDDGAGGYGSGLAQGEGYDGSGGKIGDKNKSGANSAGRLPASALVAGLTSTYNGERIGVASDDIFQMVNRRYLLKNDQDAFITLERPSRGVLGETPKK